MGIAQSQIVIDGFSPIIRKFKLSGLNSLNLIKWAQVHKKSKGAYFDGIGLSQMIRLIGSIYLCKYPIYLS